MNLTVISASLLCSLSWLSVSGSESQTVEVQSGEDVTLTCSNIPIQDYGVRFWVRLTKRSQISCIAVMKKSTDKPDFCEGYGHGKFDMWSNNSTVSLKIQSADLFDSGLYFCGFYEEGRPVFYLIDLVVRGINEVHDDSKGTKNCDRTNTLVSGILGGVSALLVMVIIGLVVKNRKLQTANKDQNPRQSASVASTDLSYAAVAFRPKARRREPEPNVIYAATR